MREAKLRDFLAFYYEIDIWHELKDISDLQNEISKLDDVVVEKFKKEYDTHRQGKGINTGKNAYRGVLRS